MRSSIPLGRVAGVPVGAHWSLLVIAGLLTFSLATGLLPFAVPEASTAGYWVAAVAGALAFLASILAHELSHAVVARRHGQRVDDITLWLFGGVARLGSEAPSARAELQVALAGPLASLAVGAAFLGGAWLAGLVALGELATTTLAWLALVNLVLAVFNLLPGAPLDGGRVLAAVLWMRRGDRTSALITAARAGAVVGWGLVGLGLANLVLGIGFGTLWTALIGYFLVTAARAEEQAARLRGSLDARTIGEVMSPAPPVAREWLTVADLDGELPPRNPDRFVLLQRREGDISGILDLEKVRDVPAGRRAHVVLADLGTPRDELETATPDEPANAVVFGGRLGRHPVVVLDHGVVAGLVGPDELEALLRRPPRAGTGAR